MAIIKDLDFYALAQSKAASPVYYEGEAPRYPLINIKPAIGMRVNVWHSRTSVDDHGDRVVPIENEDGSLHLREQFGGTGTIVAIRYKPGRSGTLYPCVDVDMDKNLSAVALGSIRTPHKAKTSAENGKRGGRPKGTPQSEATKEKIRQSRLNNRKS